MDDNIDIDPKVQKELECLNETSEKINKLENELCEKRSLYRVALSDSTQKLNNLSSKLGACIGKARPYYEAKEKAKVAQRKTQQATLDFERAVSMHDAAREMVLVAEQGMQKDKMDAAWPEMLNHATTKVNEAELERLNVGVEHQRCTEEFKLEEQKVAFLQKKLKSSITKSRPYFETKEITHKNLADLSNAVKSLDTQLGNLKISYSEALQNLEMISDAIHKARGEITTESLGERQEGVGAESLPVHYSPELERGNTSSNDGSSSKIVSNHSETSADVVDDGLRRETEGKSMNSVILSEDESNDEEQPDLNNDSLNGESNPELPLPRDNLEHGKHFNSSHPSTSTSSHSDGLLLSIASLGEMAKANPGTLPGNTLSNT